MTVIQKMLSVNKIWLEASFKKIDEIWGDFDIYRRDALAISDLDTQKLKDLYLQ